MSVAVNDALTGRVAKKLTVDAAPTLSDTTNMSSRVLVWHKDGPYFVGEGLLTWTGAGAVGTLTLTLPNSYTIDTSLIAGGTTATNAGASMLGSGTWYDAGVGWKVVYVEYNSTTTIRFSNTSALFAASVTANGDSLKFNFRVPIVGWS